MKSKAIDQLGILLLVVASTHVTSCAAVDENAIQKRLDSSVGQRFSESRWRYLAAENGVLRDDRESVRVYEFSWANGCAYQIVVRKMDDLIAGWKFTSSLELCKQVIHRPLGS